VAILDARSRHADGPQGVETVARIAITRPRNHIASGVIPDAGAAHKPSGPVRLGSRFLYDFHRFFTTSTACFFADPETLLVKRLRGKR
jgi:hypothetical protein